MTAVFSLRHSLQAALAEDLAQGDITTLATCEPFRVGTGRIVAKQKLVLSGTTVIGEVFDLLAGPGAVVKMHAADGQNLSAGTLVAEVEAPLHALLGGERVMLNLLMRMSGIATYTAEAVAALRGTSTRVPSKLRTSELTTART